jgi:U3 small nucleolar RNA-associated protein 5
VNPFDLKVPQLNQITEATGTSEESTVPFGDRVKAQFPALVASKGPAKVESIDAALIQALKTKDQDLLNRVFQTTNPVIVKRTVEKLPQNSVLPLLLFTVEKFQTNPSMANQLTIWINSVLTIHLAYLMSLPTLPKTLGPLYSVIESRLAVFQDLLRLQGRLDLLVSQIDRRRASSTTLSSEPNQVYREGDEDEDEEEEEEDEDDSNEMEDAEDFSDDSDLLNDESDEGGRSNEEMEDASE